MGNGSSLQLITAGTIVLVDELFTTGGTIVFVDGFFLLFVYFLKQMQGSRMPSAFLDHGLMAIRTLIYF
jgi:dolichyl-phosphate-mannose--protein O-mannosyl transferase